MSRREKSSRTRRLNHKELSVFKWRRQSSATKCWRLACNTLNTMNDPNKVKLNGVCTTCSDRGNRDLFAFDIREWKTNACVAVRRNDNVTSNNNCRVQALFEHPCHRNRTFYFRKCNCLYWQLGMKSARWRTTSPAISARAQRSVEIDVEVKT